MTTGMEARAQSQLKCTATHIRARHDVFRGFVFCFLTL